MGNTVLSTSSDESGIAIEDADSEERDTGHDSEDKTDSCKERVTGRHILHSGSCSVCILP